MQGDVFENHRFADAFGADEDGVMAARRETAAEYQPPFPWESWRPAIPQRRERAFVCHARARSRLRPRVSQPHPSGMAAEHASRNLVEMENAMNQGQSKTLITLALAGITAGLVGCASAPPPEPAMPAAAASDAAKPSPGDDMKDMKKEDMKEGAAMPATAPMPAEKPAP